MSPQEQLRRINEIERLRQAAKEHNTNNPLDGWAAAQNIGLKFQQQSQQTQPQTPGPKIPVLNDAANLVRSFNENIVGPVVGAALKPATMIRDAVSTAALGEQGKDQLNQRMGETAQSISDTYTQNVPQPVQDVVTIASLYPTFQGAKAVAGVAKAGIKAGAKSAAKSILPTQDAVAQNGIAEILTKTRSIQNKVREATQKNVDLQKELSDPAVYSGIKVTSGKVVPDEAIQVIDNRIESLLDAKTQALPALEKYVPKQSREILRDEAINNIKGKFSPADEVDVIKAINAQVDALPQELSISEIDNLRARFRQSSRDAKGIQKRTSEYAALENATRDTVFRLTDNLPFDTKGEFAALNKYVKDMIETKTFLDKTLRGQTLPGGRLGNLGARAIGAVAGSTGGPLTTILGAELGGTVQNILLNNNLGSSLKFQMVKGLTKDPEVLKMAEDFLKQAEQYRMPELPAGNGAVVNQGKPIPVLPTGKNMEVVTPGVVAQSREIPSISLQNTANSITPSVANIDTNVAQLVRNSKEAVSSGTESSRPSKVTSTSTSNVRTGRGDVSAQKTVTSGGFRDYAAEEYAAKTAKANAMKAAAQKRRTNGQPTDIEYDNAAQFLSGNYKGKMVKVDGKEATVVQSQFGKIKVQFADGSTKAVYTDEITAMAPTRSEVIEYFSTGKTPPVKKANKK